MNIGKINQLTNTLADELNKNGVEVTTPHRLIKERDMLRSEVKRLREGLEYIRERAYRTEHAKYVDMVNEILESKDER